MGVTCSDGSGKGGCCYRGQSDVCVRLGAPPQVSVPALLGLTWDVEEQQP